MYITASDRHYPQKTAILLNPHSGRVRKHLQAMRQLASSMPRAIVRETGSADELDRIIDELRSLGVDHLVIAGGDGTVQTVIDRLFNSGRWPVLPLISIVPGGTTNMTATDIGSTGSPRRCLERLSQCLHKAVGARLVTRQVLHIRQANMPQVYGMFFGAGAIAKGAGYFHRNIKKTGVTGESASALVIFRLLTGMLAGRRSGEWAPTHIRLLDDGGLRQDGNCKLLLASTLDRLLLGLRPYWGPGHGNMHTTCISESPRNFWLSLLKIVLRNGDRLTAADGYYSRNNEWLELTMDEGFIVDGEFFDCDSRNGPLRISTAGPVRFLLP